MLERFNTYRSLKDFRAQIFNDVSSNHLQINQVHDQIIRRAIQITITQMQLNHGSPPTPFTFFVMGSAGRFEQGYYSDQDHGIIYEEESTSAMEYYKRLGVEITKGLEIVGYTRCEGNVMCSNPLWCKPEKEWEEQIIHWITKQDWESIRHLLIFMDARHLVGDSTSVERLKELVFKASHKSPHLLQRIFDNTLHIKKGVGLLGQFLEETHGHFVGMINLKESAFFPYVNAIRLLSIKEKIKETATLERIEQLCKLPLYTQLLRNARSDFSQLLQLRHSLQSLSTPCSYDESHYLNPTRLSIEKRHELKNILRNAFQLHKQLQKFIG
jgi:CBS domain-containing protein